MYEIMYKEGQSVTVETYKEVEAKIRQLVESGVNPDCISVFHKAFQTESLVTVYFANDGQLQIEWNVDQLAEQMNQRIIDGLKDVLKSFNKESRSK